MFYVYILYADKFDKFYNGQTNNIQVRVQRHNSGSEKATMPFIPWTLKFYIEKQTRKEAMELEIKLKNLSKDRIHKFIEKYQHK